MKGPKPMDPVFQVELYQRLVRTPLIFSEKDIAYFIQIARLDPRLAEVITEHLRDYWWKYSPRKLNQKLKTQPWPHAIKPMLAQILEFCVADKETLSNFKKWYRAVVVRLPDAPPQLYFNLNLPPRSPFLDRQVNESLESFTQFGYYSTSVLFNKGFAKKISNRPHTTNTILGQSDLIKLKLLSLARKFTKDKKIREIAAKTNFDRTTISQIKSGKLVNISIERLARFVDLLK